MMYVNANQLGAYEFQLAANDSRLSMMRPAASAGSQSGGFASLLLESLNGVNEQQQTADALSVQSIVDPESVNPHDVTIAAAKANMSLSITKSVVDRVIQAYREIQNVR